MYIKREINIVLTDEEKEILEKARDILMDFEVNSSVADENTLQDMYDEYTKCIEHQSPLPTAVDLLTVVLGDIDQ